MRHSAKLGLMAAALIAGNSIPAGMSQSEAVAQGWAIQSYLKNSYRMAGAGKPSRAAHYKRVAKKRRNVRARSKK